MKSVLVCLLGLCFVEASAQSWCAPGAHWYHTDLESDLWGFDNYVETHYVGDTTIADTVCQRLRYSLHYYFEGSQSIDTVGPYDFYTATTEDIVYLRYNDMFDTLFNFGATPGDRWGVPDGSTEPGLWITVLDTGHTVIDEQTLRFLSYNVMMDDDWVLWANDTIYERIGPVFLYINLTYSAYIIIDGGYYGLRCYEDDEMNYTRVDGRCDVGLGIPLSTHSRGAILFPNPASSGVRINWAENSAPLRSELIDMSGRVIHRWAISGSTAQTTWLSLDGMAEGQYILQHSFKDGVQRTPLTIAR